MDELFATALPLLLLAIMIVFIFLLSRRKKTAQEQQPENESENIAGTVQIEFVRDFFKGPSTQCSVKARFDVETAVEFLKEKQKLGQEKITHPYPDIIIWDDSTPQKTVRDIITGEEEEIKRLWSLLQ